MNGKSIPTNKMGVLGVMAMFLLFAVIVPSASANCNPAAAIKNRPMGGQGKLQASSTLQSAAVQSGSQAQDTQSNLSIVGLWNISFLIDGQPVDQGFDAWHSDGTEVLNDITPPAEDNVCLGTWEQVGPQTFKLYHPSFTFDINGNLTGTAIIRETVTLDKDGNSFSGTFTVDVFDTSNNNLGEFAGDIKAARIRVQ